MIAIAPAVATDAATIHAIQMRAFAEEGRLSENLQIPPLMETVDAIELLIRTQTVLLARDGDRIVGSARGIRKGSVCTLRGVLVEPSHHGQGIGGALLNAVEQLHPDVERFELTTNSLVPGNVEFYQRRGYSVDELTPFTGKIVLAQMSKPAASLNRRPVKTYFGSCHCGGVRFQVETDFPELTRCDCSICSKKNALMVKVHESKFALLAGEELLTEYQFHTRTARHFFCKRCGIYPFHRKRVTPENLGINVFCLDGFDPQGIPVRQAVGAAMS